MLTQGQEILGIYVEETLLEYACAKKIFGSWKKSRPASNIPEQGAERGNALKALESLLTRISPKPSRRLYVSLPRGIFFVRQVALPAVPFEEALEIVRNSLSVHCHLPESEIYYDVLLTRTPDKAVRATLVYVPRRSVDGLLSVLTETGHRANLEGLFPLSFGWAAWLRLSGVSPPAALVLRNEEFHEVIGIRDEKLTETVRLDDMPLIQEEGVRLSPEFFVPRERIYTVDGDGFPRLPQPEGPLADFWSQPVNRGAVALMPKMAREPVLCLDGRPPRIHAFHPAKVVVPFIVALCVVAWALSWRIDASISKTKREIVQAKAAIQDLEKRLAPLKKNVEELERVRKLVEEAASFMDQRPNFYAFFNDLAQRLPEGSWISNLNYSNKAFTMKMVSPDSLKTLEALRSSPFIKDVKLKGSVRRRSDGMEHFSVSVELKGR